MHICMFRFVYYKMIIWRAYIWMSGSSFTTYAPHAPSWHSPCAVIAVNRKYWSKWRWCSTRHKQATAENCFRTSCVRNKKKIKWKEEMWVLKTITWHINAYICCEMQKYQENVWKIKERENEFNFHFCCWIVREEEERAEWRW